MVLVGAFSATSGEPRAVSHEPKIGRGTEKLLWILTPERWSDYPLPLTTHRSLPTVHRMPLPRRE
jgi:hypothetical protein